MKIDILVISIFVCFCKDVFYKLVENADGRKKYQEKSKNHHNPTTGTPQKLFRWLQVILKLSQAEMIKSYRPPVPHTHCLEARSSSVPQTWLLFFRLNIVCVASSHGQSQTQTPSSFSTPGVCKWEKRATIPSWYNTLSLWNGEGTGFTESHTVNEDSQSR